MKQHFYKKVTKRDGTEVEFNTAAIVKAVQLAAEEVNQVVDIELILGRVLKQLDSEKDMTVDTIQGAVESTLMKSSYKDVAKAYIAYRSKRDAVRARRDKYAKIGLDITSGEDTESSRENSNVPRGTITTQLEMIRRIYNKEFANDFIIPKRFQQAHESGDIHLHDADSLIIKGFNCCLMDYAFMLKNGFQLGNKYIETPTTILTAMNVLVQMVQVQSNLQHGGLTLQDIDIHLEDYVLGTFKKAVKDELSDNLEMSESEIEQVFSAFNVHPEDELFQADFPKIVRIAKRRTKVEVDKAAKLLSYQLNTLQVRGESSPFVTISYGLGTSWASRSIIEAVLDERVVEFYKSGVTCFPKNLFTLRKGVNFDEGDVNYDLFKKAINTSALTCYPDYVFSDNQDELTGGHRTYMG